MKKISRTLCSFCFILLAAVWLIGLPRASAQEYWEQPKEVFESGDYSYELLDDGTAVIVDYEGEETDIEIPDALDGHEVSEIGMQAFSYYEMASLTIPEGINVSGRAFEYCVITDSISLPAEITIRGSAFEYAELPQTMTIPEGAVVEGDCFSYCEDLRALFVEPHAALKKSVFSYSEDLQTIVCASGSEIADRAFYSCERLEKIVLCGDVKLGEKPFPYSKQAKTTAVEKADYARAVESAMGLASEPIVKVGTIKGNAYSNESLQLECRLPKAFTIAADERAESAGIFGGEKGRAPQDQRSWTDLLARTKSGDSISVVVSPVPKEVKELLYLLLPEEFAAVQGYSALGLLAAQGCNDITFAVDEEYDEFPIEESVCVCFTAVEEEEPVYIRQVLYVVDEYMVTVSAESYGADSTLDYLGLFG
jgi:hypothetical protein